MEHFEKNNSAAFKCKINKIIIGLYIISHIDPQAVIISKQLASFKLSRLIFGQVYWAGSCFTDAQLP